MSAPPVSPGGALLRASRVFSLPRPLRNPSSAQKASPTATTVYPLHQAISTPRDSIPRGDWGFKRAFPLKSTTKSSQPLIAVKAIDNVENITDFLSAGGHNVTLKKWQEMNMPLTTTNMTPQTQKLWTFDLESRRSVFEDDIDHTAVKPDAPLGSEDMRWNFKGPYLPVLNEGRFMSFFEDTVRGRGPEFREFVRRSCVQDINKEARKDAEVRAAMLDQDASEVEYPTPISPEDVTEEQLTLFVRKLRSDRVTLNQHIRAFLDLPPAPTRLTSQPKIVGFEMISKEEEVDKEEDNFFIPSKSPFAQTGPPKTHPSAGLSYLRTANFIDNHPVYGPREHKPPVEARIVMPSNSRLSGGPPLLGVGGFIAEIPRAQFNALRSRDRHSKKKVTILGLTNIEPQKPGGSKTFVQPVHAHVDPSGGVIIKVEEADEIAVAVKLEKDDELEKDMVQAESKLGIVRRNLLTRKEAPEGYLNVPRTSPSRATFGGSEIYGLEGESHPSGVSRRLNLPSLNDLDPVSNRNEIDSLVDLGGRQ